MSTSQSFTGLSEPVGPDKISQGTFGYICARNRRRQYDIVIREFKKSGITQKELTERLGSTPDIVSRLLARPSNWEADTFAKLLFAISGAVVTYAADHPFRQQSSVVTVQLIDREDGGLRVCSPTLPGLILSGRDKAEVVACIDPAIRSLFERMGHKVNAIRETEPIGLVMKTPSPRDVEMHVHHEKVFLVEYQNVA